MVQFDWDEEKNRLNLAKHRLDFETAQHVFQDLHAFEQEERSIAYGEVRLKITGLIGDRLVTVISRREPTAIGLYQREKRAPMNAKTAKKIADSRDDFDWLCFDAITDEEAEEQARQDPDNFPITESTVRTARSKIIRRALDLTQEEFAARYHIPLGTLRDWEQHRSEPDQAAHAYLKVIAKEPDMAARALADDEAAAVAE